MKLPVLYIVVPCYNEEAVLPLTAPEFLAQLESLTDKRKIHSDSRILFVDDGSKDNTWALIRSLSAEDPRFCGISLSRNRGHQNALVAVLLWQNVVLANTAYPQEGFIAGIDGVLVIKMG